MTPSSISSAAQCSNCGEDLISAVKSSPKNFMNVNREELAWAAGFFDGEGNIHAAKLPSGRKFLTLQVSQVNRQPLDRFQKAVGSLGNVVGPYKRRTRLNAQPIYHYQNRRFESAQAVIALLWNFLSEPKRQQATRVLKIIKDNPPFPLRSRRDSHGLFCCSMF